MNPYITIWLLGRADQDDGATSSHLPTNAVLYGGITCKDLISEALIPRAGLLHRVILVMPAALTMYTTPTPQALVSEIGA